MTSEEFQIDMKHISTMLLAVCAIGCGQPAVTPVASSPSNADRTESATEDTASTQPSPEGATRPAPVRAIPTIKLGGGSASLPIPEDAGPDEARQRKSLLKAMMPLQVMLGTWKSTTQKEFGDFKALAEPEWVWDFLSDEDQPAMVMMSEQSPYFRELRLTYLSDEDTYRLQLTDPDGLTRTLAGTFSSPVEEFQGDDKKLHHKYKLELTETNPPTDEDPWKVVLNQQDNNRYLVELERQRGLRFVRFDTVANQRQGTSFALNDADYGEKKCIISGGLGTMQVSYQGRSYWVCCSGCKAAFEEDPATWIAEAAKMTNE